MKATQQRAINALEKRQFFKLICGGSFTEADKIQKLTQLYAQAGGVDVIDIAPDLTVLSAVKAALNNSPVDQRPLVMVSLPLDPDPHFRKIDVDLEACIDCNLCVPVCPTDALKPALPDNNPEKSIPLSIEQPACYGCGRCPQVCPTEALTLHPHHPPVDVLKALLLDPAVGAVEIHTRQADPAMLEEFLNTYGDLFLDKLFSVCFRPNEADAVNWLPFIQKLQMYSAYPVVLQIDGASMTGTDSSHSYLPAIQNALLANQVLSQNNAEGYYLTISGGINNQTASILKQSPYHFIAGAGLGTFARRWVWSALDGNPQRHTTESITKAKQLVTLFKQQWPKSAIINNRETIALPIPV